MSLGKVGSCQRDALEEIQSTNPVLQVHKQMTLACEAGTSLCAGMLACSEDAAAGVGMLCVLFKQWLVSVRT